MFIEIKKYSNPERSKTKYTMNISRSITFAKYIHSLALFAYFSPSSRSILEVLRLPVILWTVSLTASWLCCELACVWTDCVSSCSFFDLINFMILEFRNRSIDFGIFLCDVLWITVTIIDSAIDITISATKKITRWPKMGKSPFLVGGRISDRTSSSTT